MLTSDGKSLESAVKESFKFLGFREISNKRPEKEDWVFKFKSLSDYKYGIMEVQGTNRRIDLDHIRECEGWAWDYTKGTAESKGIFIANQFRTEAYPNSKDKRCEFDHNQVKYATEHKICILPSCILFDMVRQHLEFENMSREHLEKAIAKTNGILKVIPLS